MCLAITTRIRKRHHRLIHSLSINVLGSKHTSYKGHKKKPMAQPNLVVAAIEELIIKWIFEALDHRNVESGQGRGTGGDST